MTQVVRTRFWSGDMTSTAIQFRDDVEVPVWMHTNIGWVPVSNSSKQEMTLEESEKLAEDLAISYELTERSPETAWRMLGL